MPRPRSDRPYLCGPYAHRRKFRVFLYTPRGDGGRDRNVRSFDSASAAETWIRGFKQVVAASGRTVGAAVTEYTAHLERKGNKPGSIKTARYRLDAILDFSRALIDLTQGRAQRYYDELVDEGGATDTHRGCLIAAKAFGKFCREKGWLSNNPFEKVSPVGRKSRGKAQLRIDEARKFQAHCLKAWTTKGDRSAIAAVLPLVMSLRANEVAQLVARDVDDKGRILMVGEHDAKTEAARRMAKVPGWLVPIMTELAASPAAGDHLFARENGMPADRHWVAYHTRRHLKAARVPPITTHGLRGTYATLRDIEGADRRALAKDMGHEDPTMTKDHYIDPQASADAATDRVASMLDDEGEP